MALGDQWRKVLAYFGMADDEDDYYEEEDEAPRRRPSREAEDLERSYEERPNVRRIGSSRRRAEEFDDIFSDEETTVAPRAGRDGGRSQTAEVNLIIPKAFNDAQQIADKFKQSVPVIINMQTADNELSRRLIDFASGLTYAMDGGMQRVADKVFLLTPANVEVSAEERARLMDRGFFNQY
jgi:cell division inhibitor SepF